MLPGLLQRALNLGRGTTQSSSSPAWKTPNTFCPMARPSKRSLPCDAVFIDKKLHCCCHLLHWYLDGPLCAASGPCFRLGSMYALDWIHHQWWLADLFKLVLCSFKCKILSDAHKFVPDHPSSSPSAQMHCETLRIANCVPSTTIPCASCNKKWWIEEMEDQHPMQLN